MSERYATIVKNDAGEEEVSVISQMEGVPPEIRSDLKKTVKVEKVPDGVLIGMVRGGKKDAVGGFGFPENSTDSAADRGNGVTRFADTMADKGVRSSDPNVKERYETGGTSRRAGSASSEDKPGTEGTKEAAQPAKGKAA
ncbi:MAG TPA: hypothetical protein VEA41_23430 [Salinarimonas sp.]|nr:hypothetical protein [Salinarimonas sp.]